jgi:hypothetical protein
MRSEGAAIAQNVKFFRRGPGVPLGITKLEGRVVEPMQVASALERELEGVGCRTAQYETSLRDPGEARGTVGVKSATSEHLVGHRSPGRDRSTEDDP